MLTMRFKVITPFLALWVFVLSHASGARDLPTESEKFDSLILVAWDNIFDKRQYSLDIANHISENYRYLTPRQECNLLYLKGYVYHLGNQFDQAAKIYFEGLDLFNDGKNHDILRGKMLLLQNLGSVFEKTYDYTTAEQYYGEALEIAKSLKLKEEIATLKYAVGVENELSGNYIAALDYYNQALSDANEHNFRLIELQTKNSMGNCFNKQYQFSTAKTYYHQALYVADQDPALEKASSFSVSNLGEVALKLKQYDSAVFYYSKALEISTKHHDTTKIKWLLNNLGNVYLETKDYEKAIHYFEKSLALAEEEKIDDEVKRACKHIAQAYDGLNNFEMASIYKSKYIHQTELLETTQAELQKKNAQYRIKEVKWQRELQASNEKIRVFKIQSGWFQGGIVILSLILIFISYHTRRFYLKISRARKLLYW